MVSRGIYQFRRGICQISPRKIVGPSDNILTLATSAPRSAVRKNLTVLAETSLPRCRGQTSLPPPGPARNPPPPPPAPRPENPTTMPLATPPPAAETLPYLRGAPRKTSLTRAARPITRCH